METTVYYGMNSNPFTKETTHFYESNDYKQMVNRLEFLIKTRGVGVFMSSPGMGKTTCLRKTLNTLNPNRYKVIYICMTTVTSLDFYRSLNDALGLEESTRKSQMFHQIQEELRRLVCENKMEIIIAIDEAQFLKKEIIREFVMLLNFDFDSKDFCTFILTGQNEMLRTLNLKMLEAFRQRININYTFTGFDEKEVEEYIVSRLKIVHCREDLFTKEAYHTLFTLMKGSVRNLNQLINKALIIGVNKQAATIDSEIIKEASEEMSLG